ncbi:hypothetical protein HU200_038135 [Digitaria exilis]|uniref:DUF4220 domain-containing protein n=1 Tax=Digitaria exilis TaxID=1010633 RepID=A0A835EGP0_9POAL|nr:hypothetical protein HU200_038135 [Digitaria exilis]
MPDQVSQYNLIGYLARNRKHSWFRKLATLLVCKDYLDQLWCMKPCKSSSDITAIVHDHVRDAWKKHVIVDVSTYRDFHDIRGQWALERWGLLDILGPSLQRPFDESVLLWHLATDFCFYSTDASCTSSSHSQHTIAARDLSRKISNYMMYLLFVNPEMLMAGARRNLFRAAYCELKDLLKDNEGPPLNARKLTGKIVEDLKKVSCPQEQTPSASRQHFVPCAYWEVAKPLLSIKDEEKMWLAIQGVWVEMLCFSARRCRGYLHAKSLGKGGEYLSYVWLLQLYMGMETSAEILQRTRLQQEESTYQIKFFLVESGILHGNILIDATRAPPSQLPDLPHWRKHPTLAHLKAKPADVTPNPSVDTELEVVTAPLNARLQWSRG